MKNLRNILLVVLIIALISIPGCFSLSSNVEEIKTTLIPSETLQYPEYSETEFPLENEFQFSIGPIGLFFAYAAVSLASAFDEENIDFAKDLLNEIDEVQVGVFKITDSTMMIPNQKIRETQTKLENWGYQQIVKHKENGQIVLVYINYNADFWGNDEIVVLVVENQELVIVDVEADLESLMKIAIANKEIGNKIDLDFKNE